MIFHSYDSLPEGILHQPTSTSSTSTYTDVVMMMMMMWCLCLRLENRTCVLLLFWVLLFVLGLGWGGVGGHVNVPCTSYRIYCHVAKISGLAYYVTCCYAAEISSVGWGWGWVGWGGMQTFLVLRTWYIAMLLRSLGSLTTWHVATLLRCHAIPALLAVALWVP